MTKITPTEVDRILAEKVFHNTYGHKGCNYGAFFDAGYWVCEKCQFVMKFKPLVDSNHALQVLKAWKAKQPNRFYAVSEPCKVDLACCVLNEVYECGNIYLVGCCSNPNLNHAIATALLEAVTGERYEIKEQS